MRASEAADLALRNPITGISACCARAVSGIAAAPPSKLVNLCRLMVSPRLSSGHPRRCYRSRFLMVGFRSSLLPTRDLRRQHHRELGMGCSGKMDPVPLQEISRYHWVKNDDADKTPPQLINDGRNISGALFLRPEETEIISARLQDDDIGVVGYIAIDASEHAGGSITDDAGTGDYSIDAARPGQQNRGGKAQNGAQSREWRLGAACCTACCLCRAGAAILPRNSSAAADLPLGVAEILE